MITYQGLLYSTDWTYGLDSQSGQELCCTQLTNIYGGGCVAQDYVNVNAGQLHFNVQAVLGQISTGGDLEEQMAAIQILSMRTPVFIYIERSLGNVFNDVVVEGLIPAGQTTCY